MGNALKILAECVCGSERPQYGYSQQAGCAAFSRDLLHFEKTGQVPEGLSNYVEATRATQVIWYRKLLDAWQSLDQPPTHPHDVARFIIDTVNTRRKKDSQGFLQYYGLPHAAVIPDPGPPSKQALYPKWPQGVQYEFTTLPVGPHDVADGDTITVYVDVSDDTRETKAMPPAVLKAISRRRKARSTRDYGTADALQKEISNAGYKVFDTKGDSDEVIAHKYRIRLRGVDAPEKSMPYGSESKFELVSLVEGQALRVHVYTADQYGRLVADVHTRQGFVQEMLLKRGCVWHYKTYDNRPEFSQWEKEAREARIGLWADSHPQKPWEYRKEHKF